MNQVAINTTQNVNINFNLASFGDRLLGYIIDELIKIAYIIAISYLFFSIFDITAGLDNWESMAVAFILFSPAVFYSLLLETFFEGQTLGKRFIKTKVVKIDGYQASFGDYLIRWIMRLVDIYSNSALVGVISIISSKKAQRLGDMAAGTAIITLKNNYSISSTILVEISDTYNPVFPSVVKFSDNDMRIIKNTFITARTKMDHDTLLKLRTKIEQVAEIQNHFKTDIEFIQTVLKDYNYYTQKM